MRAGAELAGRYRLEERLGRGGMGEVWSGFDQTLRRRVAIKLLLAHLLDDESAAHGVLARFRREGMAAAQLNHRNIAGVYDFGEHRQDYGYGVERAYPFLVLEYLDGRDLKTVLKQWPSGGLPIEDVLNYGAQACDGLAAAHAAGIVHRDIKPANLMLLSDGTIKVCDFGIARIQDATAGLTKTGSQLGTPAYMAPEQLNGRQVDHRADLYALGATLYHLFTSRPVFPTRDPRVLSYMHLTRTPDPPSSLRPGISADIDRLIISLLAKNPDQRPVAASHIAAALRAALSSVDPQVWPKGVQRGAEGDLDQARVLPTEPERIAIPIADLEAMAPERAAAILKAMAPERAVTALEVMAPKPAAAILKAMGSGWAVVILGVMAPERAAAILMAMAPEPAVVILGGMAPVWAAAILEAMGSVWAAATLKVMAPEPAAATLKVMAPEPAAATLKAMGSERAVTALEAMAPKPAAAILEAMGSGWAVVILGVMAPERAAAILKAMGSERAAATLKAMDPEPAAAILKAMAPVWAVAILMAMGSVWAAATLKVMAPKPAAAILKVMGSVWAAAILKVMDPVWAAAILKVMDPE